LTLNKKKERKKYHGKNSQNPFRLFLNITNAQPSTGPEFP
jgi:hypothetical protein